MAKKNKKPIVHKRTVKDSLILTGLLEIDNLQGFVMDMEEIGLVDVSDKLQVYNGAQVTISITQKMETDLTSEE